MVDYKKKYLKYKLKYLELIGGSGKKTNYSTIASDLLVCAFTNSQRTCAPYLYTTFVDVTKDEKDMYYEIDKFKIHFNKEGLDRFIKYKNELENNMKKDSVKKNSEIINEILNKILIYITNKIAEKQSKVAEEEARLKAEEEAR